MGLDAERSDIVACSSSIAESLSLQGRLVIFSRRTFVSGLWRDPTLYSCLHRRLLQHVERQRPVSEEVEKAGRCVVVADGRRIPADQRGEMIASERHDELQHRRGVCGRLRTKGYIRGTERRNQASPLSRSVTLSCHSPTMRSTVRRPPCCTSASPRCADRQTGRQRNARPKPRTIVAKDVQI